MQEPHGTLFGYAIESCKEDLGHGEVAEYRLIGKRGGVYHLIRHDSGRSFYVRNRLGNVCAVKGNYTITAEHAERQAAAPVLN